MGGTPPCSGFGKQVGLDWCEVPVGVHARGARGDNRDRGGHLCITHKQYLPDTLQESRANGPAPEATWTNYLCGPTYCACIVNRWVISPPPPGQWIGATEHYTFGPHINVESSLLSFVMVPISLSSTSASSRVVTLWCPRLCWLTMTNSTCHYLVSISIPL
jgi:hypothetical protein